MLLYHQSRLAISSPDEFLVYYAYNSLTQFRLVQINARGLSCLKPEKFHLAKCTKSFIFIIVLYSEFYVKHRTLYLYSIHYLSFYHCFLSQLLAATSNKDIFMLCYGFIFVLRHRDHKYFVHFLIRIV